jgi:hypothetical protein
MTSRKKCTFNGCNLPIISRGLCNTHYRKLLRSKQTNCSFELCDKPIKNITHQLCYTHYEIYLKENNLQKKKTRPRYSNVEDAWKWCLDNWVTRDKQTNCLVWLGTIRDGYGKFRWKNDEVSVYVHIYAYEKNIGSVGNSVVDHTCRNRLCMNVDHLELITNEENSKRANLLEGNRSGIGWVDPNQKSIDHFWKTVDKSVGGCWLWFGTPDGKGFMNYGRFLYQNHRQRPYRFSYWLVHKSLSDGYAIHHKCDVKVCVRPDHLKEITLKDNAAISQSKYIDINEDILFSEKKRKRLMADATRRMITLEKQKKFKDIRKKKNSLKSINEKNKKRFFTKVDKESSTIGCWLWTDKIEKAGHGRFWLNGSNISAHYVSWLIHYGNINSKVKIHQTCNDLACVNPDHLESMSKNESLRRGRAKSLKKQKLKPLLGA